MGRDRTTLRATRLFRRASLLAILTGAVAATSLGACSFIETDDLTGGEPHKDASSAATAPDSTIALADARATTDSSSATDALADAPTEDANPADAASDAGGDADADAAPLTYAQMILAEGPLAYWRLGDTGLIATSEVGTNLSGGISSSVTVGVPGAIVGDPNTAVHFNGTMGTIGMPDILGFDGTSPFTFELWTRVAAVDNIYRRLFGREGSTAGYNYTLLYQMYEPGLSFGIATPSANAIVTGAHPLPVNVWSHVVVTYDGTSVSLYENGVIAGISLVTHAVNDGGAATFRLGSDTYSASELNGDLDEVAVYGKALDAGTIAAHFAAAGPHDAGADADAGDAAHDATADH